MSGRRQPRDLPLPLGRRRGSENAAVPGHGAGSRKPARPASGPGRRPRSTARWQVVAGATVCRERDGRRRSASGPGPVRAGHLAWRDGDAWPPPVRACGNRPPGERRGSRRCGVEVLVVGFDSTAGCAPCSVAHPVLVSVVVLSGRAPAECSTADPNAAEPTRACCVRRPGLRPRRCKRPTTGAVCPWASRRGWCWAVRNGGGQGGLGGQAAQDRHQIVRRDDGEGHGRVVDLGEAGDGALVPPVEPG